MGFYFELERCLAYGTYTYWAHYQMMALLKVS